MRRLVFDFIVPVLHLNPRLQQINTRVVVGDVLLCGLIKGNIPGCCCCVPPPLSLYSLSHTVMRNGSRVQHNSSFMSSIPKPAARNRHRKLAFHPHPFSLACTLWVALPHQPRFVTFSLLMVLSSYHLTGKLIPVFDYCQPQHNDPYPSPLVLLKLLFNGIGCQDNVIILF